MNSRGHNESNRAGSMNNESRASSDSNRDITEGEWFDVVNEFDQVIGRAPRTEVHRRGLLHRAAHVWVFDRNGRVFLQKRSMAKECFPGKWDSSASGHLGVDESYADCAVRELLEELGCIPDDPLEPLFKLSACLETGNEFAWIYRAEDDGPFQLQASEIDDGAWFTEAEIERWMQRAPDDFAGTVRLIWARLHETP